MLTLLLQADTEFEWRLLPSRELLQLTAAAAAGALIAALLLGQAYAYAERRIANLIGGAQCPS